MNFSKPYEDLREFIASLDANEKLYRIDREINKDTELQPLVRWQFRGGIPESARRGFLFNNVTDGKKTKYNCSPMAASTNSLFRYQPLVLTTAHTSPRDIGLPKTLKPVSATSEIIAG
jgi:3-polyprenyl-4-hydroxybenzoate decarboxylase